MSSCVVCAYWVGATPMTSQARMYEEEEKRRKRSEETNRIIWDGHQSSIAQVGVTVNSNPGDCST